MSTSPATSAHLSPGPAWIYLHGFASSTTSTKARAFGKWGHERGVAVEVLDLRVPSFAQLRLSAMLARVRGTIDAHGPRARAVAIGSSLGGLLACRAAETDPRICGLFLMAPAFRLAERWRLRIGEAAWEAWKREGSLEVDDWASGGKSRVDFGFVDEIAKIEAAAGNDGWPDVRVPVCIVHGRQDEVVDIELSRTWVKGRPNARLVEVDDGHELGASIPKILAEADDFFRGYGATRRG